jgi:hypothetical protein
VFLLVFGAGLAASTELVRADQPQRRSSFENVAMESSPADDSQPTSEQPPAAAPKRIDPDRFQEVDEAARLMVWLTVACSLGAISVLALIIVGARRIRQMTRSPLLKSKYDELENLRAQYRRELEGTDTPPPRSREVR